MTNLTYLTTIIYSANILLLIINSVLLILILYRNKNVSRRAAGFHLEHQHILEHAHNQARQVLDQASTKATDLVQDAGSASRNITHRIEDSLNSITHTHQDLLAATYSDIAQKNQALFNDLSAETQKHARRQLEEIRYRALENFDEYFGGVKKHTTGLQQEFEEQIRREQQSAREAIARYKEQKTAELDASAQQIIHSVTKQVLPQALSTGEHLELIKRALTKAKAEGGF